MSLKLRELHRYVSAEGLLHKFFTAFETENELLTDDKFSSVQFSSELVSFEKVI